MDDGYDIGPDEERFHQPQERNLEFTAWSSLGVLTTRPKRPDWAPKDIRLKSFSQWREDHHIKVNDLVEAGFYYGGRQPFFPSF